MIDTLDITVASLDPSVPAAADIGRAAKPRSSQSCSASSEPGGS